MLMKTDNYLVRLPDDRAGENALTIIGTGKEPAEVHNLRRRIMEFWRENDFIKYVFYREESPDNRTFRLDAFPYYMFESTCEQNLNLLFWITFGSLRTTPPPTLPYERLQTFKSTAKKVEQLSLYYPCPFCIKEQTALQEIFRGRTISLLYNPSPLCRAHFLLTTCEHRATALDVTEEEYVESQEMITKLIAYFKDVAPYAFIFERTGLYSRDWRPHWCTQVAFAGTRTEAFITKFAVLSRTCFGMQILPSFGKSNLSSEELTTRVMHYRQELPPILR